MDATKAARYEEIVAGFTREELNRLPLALEHCSTLEEFIRSTDPAVTIDLRADRTIELIDALKDIMASESFAMEEKPYRGLLNRRSEEKRIARIDGLKEQREKLYGQLVREYFFMQVSFELHELILSARSSSFPERFPEGHLRETARSAIAEQQANFTEIHRGFMDRLTQLFRVLDSSYESHSRSMAMLRELYAG